MSIIKRSVSKYTGTYAHLNNTTCHDISCKKSDIYRCIVTVGNPNFLSNKEIKNHGIGRVLCDSIIKKCLIVYVNIRNNNGRLTRHGIFDGYVTDEKRIVSYNLGMAFAKFHSERLLDIRNLIHVEFLRKLGAVTFIPVAGNIKPQEPDLVGQSSDGLWHIFEAKGVSTDGKLPGKIREGKQQAKQVSTIHGNTPATRSVSATYIGHDQIISSIEDPPEDGYRAIEIKSNIHGAYYAPFFVVQKSQNKIVKTTVIDGIPVHMFEIENSEGTLSIGLTSEVYDALQTEGGENLLSAWPKDYLIDRESDKFSFGPDGFVIGFSPKK